MAIQGRIPVSFGDVFPHGVFATGPAVPLENFETKRQETDKDTGLPVWVVDVYDADPEASHKNSAIRIKVAAQVCPVVPEPMFGPFRPCEFDGLTVTPYVEETGTDRNGRVRTRVAYSWRARGVRPASGPGKAAARPAASSSSASSASGPAKDAA
ncbi:plasmid replication, integration and excision activator [Actinomadura parmotrematis]|uniref:Plasmid replication, integration and excision activator n=1 Tax=Actinomadura parmotrematis TaxID=2864039 RepID=A0ABS7FXF4_9ACTN|nr:plasmid replication, integration and excision activator [Actinomadura parmotrematis]MBW8485113.1 plasmid replication, integration and excision activator [Actinomadura parmotrematis]